MKLENVPNRFYSSSRNALEKSCLRKEKSPAEINCDEKESFYFYDKRKSAS